MPLMPNTCPHGFRFGAECDKHEQCEECDVWTECFAASGSEGTGGSLSDLLADVPTDASYFPQLFVATAETDYSGRFPLLEDGDFVRWPQAAEKLNAFFRALRFICYFEDGPQKIHHDPDEPDENWDRAAHVMAANKIIFLLENDPNPYLGPLFEPDDEQAGEMFYDKEHGLVARAKRFDAGRRAATA